MTLGFEIYNFALAQDSGLPNLETSVRVFDKTGRMVWEEGLPSLAFQLVGNRIVVLHQIDLSRFDAGDYRIEVVARDAIRDQSVIGSRGFSVIVSAEVSTR